MLRWIAGSGVLGLLAVGDPSGIFAAGVVGNGTPESCTEAELDAVLASGGVVTFDCGSSPVIITLQGAKAIYGSLTLDGGGLVTLSGGNSHRLFRSYEGATFNLLNLTVADGSTGPGGGGSILNRGATITLTNSTLRDNTATGPGGGIVNLGGALTLNKSTVSGNSSPERAGGIYNSGGTLTVINSTVSGNSADYAAGILNDAGGAVSLTNGTVAGNNASSVGGIGNESGTVTMTNSIIVDSGGGNCSGSIADAGHNLQWPGTSCGDTIPSLDPLLDLDGLAAHGGPTHTIALQTGSAAIDAGAPEVCADPPVNGVDQRGYKRPGTGSTTCSIGAYEFDSAGPPTACGGDCYGDGKVSVDELVTLVNIALGTVELSACTAGDWNTDAKITVDELVLAVNAALTGCPGP